ncbi:hypothetical protein ACRAWF_40865 [Streptomyces sp. L7]
MRGLRPEDVRHWTQTWFTAGNVVLWIAGERFPAGLTLKLPPGARHPLPAVTSALPTTPAHFADGQGGVLLDSVVTDTTAARLLRRRPGARNSPAPCARRTATPTRPPPTTPPAATATPLLTAFADSLPAKQDAVLGGFVDVLAALQAGRIAPADLEAVRARADAGLRRRPTRPYGDSPGAAEDLLAGRAPRGLDELRHELWSVTPGQLHAVALEAAGTALLQVPSGHSASWAGYAEAPVRSTYAVTGRRFEAVAKDGSALVVGDDGVSVTVRGRDGGDLAVTVPYRSCAAVLSWPDGGRRLIGTDGLAVSVEPGLYGVDAHTMAMLDAVPYRRTRACSCRRGRAPARGGTRSGADRRERWCCRARSAHRRTDLPRWSSSSCWAGCSPSSRSRRRSSATTPRAAPANGSASRASCGPSPD